MDSGRTFSTIRNVIMYWNQSHFLYTPPVVYKWKILLVLILGIEQVQVKSSFFTTAFHLDRSEPCCRRNITQYFPFKYFVTAQSAFPKCAPIVHLSGLDAGINWNNAALSQLVGVLFMPAAFVGSIFDNLSLLLIAIAGIKPWATWRCTEFIIKVGDHLFSPLDKSACARITYGYLH